MKINPDNQHLIPCQSPTLSALWTAEDREDREVARVLCRDCPLIIECRKAGQLEVWGVWGGIDRSRRAGVACSHCGHSHARPVCGRRQCVHAAEDCPGFGDSRPAARARWADRRARERAAKLQRQAEAVA